MPLPPSKHKTQTATLRLSPHQQKHLANALDEAINLAQHGVISKPAVSALIALRAQLND